MITKYSAPYTRAALRRCARRDGAANLPSAGVDTASGKIAELKRAASLEANELARRWAARHHSLRREHQDAEAALAHERHRLAELRDDHGDNAGPHMNGVVAWVGTLVLILGDFGISVTALRVLGDAELAIIPLGLAIAAALLAVAHVIGIKLRQFTDGKGLTATEIALIVTSVVVEVGSSCALAILREIVSRRAGESSSILITVVFVVIQLLIVLAAVLLSYLAYAPVAGQQDRVKQAERRCIATRVNLESERRTAVAEVTVIKQRYEELCQAYATECLRHRTDGAVPPCYTQERYITTPLPEIFTETPQSHVQTVLPRSEYDHLPVEENERC